MKVERVEGRRQRRREGERGSRTFVCPLPLAPMNSYNSLPRHLLQDSSWPEMQDFQAQPQHSPLQSPTMDRWQGGQNALSIFTDWHVILFLSMDHMTEGSFSHSAYSSYNIDIFLLKNEQPDICFFSQKQLDMRKSLSILLCMKPVM